MKNLRWGIAVLWAVIAFPVSFLIFNIVFLIWAEKTYPHNNSMAGLAAFMYGFPVALVASVATFIAALAITNQKRRPQQPD